VEGVAGERAAPALVVNSDGQPADTGWSRRPVWEYLPGYITLSPRKMTQNDRYIVFSPTSIFAFDFHDGGYFGGVHVSAVILRDRKIITDFLDVPFPNTVMAFPASADEGGIRIKRRKNTADIIVRQRANPKEPEQPPEIVRIIRIDAPDFARAGSLRCELVLSRQSGTECLITNMPWHGEKYAFQYSRKEACLTAEGVVQFDNTAYVFTKGNAWAILDWNREVRPFRDVHFLACACGKYWGREAGFSIGFGSADAINGTENAFFFDGKLHKLAQVTFHISPKDWMAQWRFTSNDKRLEMTFNPIASGDFTMRSLGRSYRSQTFFGFFSGSVTLDDGMLFSFRNLTGFAERRKTRR
jgi:hypothetical protein